MNDLPPSPGSPVSSRTLLALTEALEHTFDASAWTTLAVALDMPQLADPDGRLQESLRLRDDDYGFFIAQFLRHLQDERPGALRDIACLPAVSAWLGSNAPDAAQALGSGRQHTAPTQKQVRASEAVDQALKDAQHPSGTSGPAGRVERVHTALHGYLRDACARAGLPVADDANVTQLLESLRQGHPALLALEQRAPEVGNALTSLAEAVTALGESRSIKSMSAPDQAPMVEAERMLALDLVRTLVDYLSARL